MRKQFFNSFKLYKAPQPFRYLQQSLKQNPKMSWNVGSATLFASFVTLVGKSFHDKAQNSTQSSHAEQSPITHAQVQFEPFNDEKYQDALKNKFDVVVFVNPENWADHLVDEVNVILSGLQDYQKMTKGRKIKFLTFQPETKEQAKEFAEKYGAKVNRDTLFFLKNRFSDSFKEFTLEDWFDNQRSLYAYFKKLQKLTSDNFDKFAGSVAHLDSDMKVLLTYIPKNASQEYKKQIKEAGKLAMNFATSSGGDITSFAVTNPEVAAKLGLGPKDEGKVLMMTKSSKYNNYGKTVNIGGVNLLILQTPIEIGGPIEKAKTSLSDFYKENFTFMKSDFDQLNVKYSLVLQVNENKIKKHELNQCIETFNEAHRELKANHPDLFKDIKIVKYKSHLHDRPFRVYVQNDKDRTDDLYLKYYNKKPLTNEQKEKIDKQGSQSFVYEFPEEKDLNKQSLIQFLKDVKDSKVPQHFGSGKEVNIQKYSNKVVQDTYKKEILDVDKDHAVFLCTKHCPGCKFMGKFFEEFALENLRNPESKVQYNRINSEKNTLQYLPNYPYTPVFVVLKKEEKLTPFVYKAQYALPQLLKDFIDITVSQSLIGRDVEKRIFDSYLANRKLFDGMKLEEIKN